MEINFTKPNSFKLKGKKTLVTIVDAKVSIGEFVIPGAGEYEVGGVDVIGIKDDVYRIKVDTITIGYIPRKLTDEEKNILGSVNIVITPADISFDNSLEPSYVIPFGSKEDIDKFAKELGAENITALPKLVTTADKLPETTTVVVLE